MTVPLRDYTAMAALSFFACGTLNASSVLLLPQSLNRLPMGHCSVSVKSSSHGGCQVTGVAAVVADGCAACQKSKAPRRAALLPIIPHRGWNAGSKSN